MIGTTGRWAPSTPEAVNARIRQARMPNETLVDQNGRSVRFYDDVMKGNRVVVNVMYTVCSESCTPAMRNLVEARRMLGAEGRNLKFVSLTLTPLTDTPEVLREYIKKNEMPADWTFLTGKQEPIERVQRGLGFVVLDLAPGVTFEEAQSKSAAKLHLQPYPFEELDAVDGGRSSRPAQ